MEPTAVQQAPDKGVTSLLCLPFSSGPARSTLSALAAISTLHWPPVTRLRCGGGPTINTSKPVPVALLVPRGSAQSGDSVLAQSLENAARLAIADLQGVQIDLRVYDTAGDADTAAAAATRP